MYNVQPRGHVRNLPSIFPCSQSTITQSTPERARIREIFAPGSICHTPMEGPLFSIKACLSLFALIILFSGSIVENKRVSLLEPGLNLAERQRETPRVESLILRKARFGGVIVGNKRPVETFRVRIRLLLDPRGCLDVLVVWAAECLNNAQQEQWACLPT